MGYTRPEVKAYEDDWSAADHNTYYRDNFAAGIPDLMTAKGSLVVATAADNAVELLVGANDTCLVADSGEACGLKWDSVIVPIGGIIMWAGVIGSIPANFKLCDGDNGTPNLQNKMVLGAGSTYSVGDTGGSKAGYLPSHNHGSSGNTGFGGSHTHTIGETDNESSHVHSYSFASDGPSATFAANSGSTNFPSSTHTHTISGTTDAGDAHKHRMPDTDTADVGYSHAHTQPDSGNSSDTFVIEPEYYSLAYIMRIW